MSTTTIPNKQKYGGLYGGRILATQKITDLTEAVNTTDGEPFSVLIIPKTEAEGFLTVNCKLLRDTDAKDRPIRMNYWSEEALSEITADAIDLDLYDVWIGASDYLNL
jgi:hypothetical protein